MFWQWHNMKYSCRWNFAESTWIVINDSWCYFSKHKRLASYTKWILSDFALQKLNDWYTVSFQHLIFAFSLLCAGEIKSHNSSCFFKKPQGTQLLEWHEFKSSYGTLYKQPFIFAIEFWCLIFVFKHKIASCFISYSRELVPQKGQRSFLWKLWTALLQLCIIYSFLIEISGTYKILLVPVS